MGPGADRQARPVGGRGNAAQIVATIEFILREDVWRPCFQDFPFPYGFQGAEEYRAWLVQAGMEPRRVELIPKDMVHPDRAGLGGWIRTTWLPYTQRVPDGDRPAFIRRIADAYLERHPADPQGRIHVEMVRLEVEAIKP